MDESSPRDHGGVDDTTAVRAYLIALRDRRPQRGRPKDPRRLERKIAELDDAIERDTRADPLKTLSMLQERIELRSQLESLRQRSSLQELTEAFIAAVPGYSSEHDISYAAWRELGVPALVLRRAGLNG